MVVADGFLDWMKFIAVAMVHDGAGMYMITNEPVKMSEFVAMVVSNFDVQKSKVYQDKKNGILRVNSEGLIEPKDAEIYIKTLASKQSEETAEMVQKKLMRQIRKLDAEISRLEHANKVNEQKYIEKSFVESYVTSRFALLHTQISSSISTMIREVRHAGSESIAYDLLVKKIDGIFRDIAQQKHFELIVSEVDF